MENKSHALAAGSFVLLALGLLVALVYWLGRDTVQRQAYEIATTESVSGLQAQAAVRYKGVPVGRVSSIALDAAQPGQVLLRLAIDPATPISSATFARLEYQGVTGLAYVALDDTGAAPQPLQAPAGQPARIPLRQGMLARLSLQGGQLVEQLGEASARANAMLAPDKQAVLMRAIQNLGEAAAQLQATTLRAEHVLLAPNAAGQVPLAALLAQADASLKTMQTTADTLRVSADAVRTSADEFKRMSARMNATGGTLDKVSQGVDSLVPRLARTADDGSRLVRQVGRVVDAVGEQPQSLWWGKDAAAPGPGEPGFHAPVGLHAPRPLGTPNAPASP